MNTELEISTTTATETPAYNSRRNGHVARLPKILRDKVNRMLDDGFEYAAIIAELEKSTNPPLPHPINADNISNWKKGGFQDWLKERQQVDAVHGFFELVTDMVANAEADEIPDLTVKLLATRVCGVLTQLTPAQLQESISDDPKSLSKILGLVPKLSREALRTRKYRRTVAREDAQELKQRDPNKPFGDDNDHRAVVDIIDRVLGLGQYTKRRVKQPQAATPVVTHNAAPVNTDASAPPNNGQPSALPDSGAPVSTGPS